MLKRHSFFALAPAAALGFLAAAAISCAKPPSWGHIDYQGYVGSGPDWDKEVSSVQLTIDPAATGPDISPLIYGHNSQTNAAQNGLGSLRAGGNRFTAYNWENNASNAGNDYMFQSDGYLVQRSTMPDAPGEAVRPMLELARQIGAGAIVTVPNVDYVSADKNADGDVRMSGPDYLMTRFKQNRATSGGAPLADPTAPDATDGFVYQDQFVAWAKAGYSDVHVMFSLDNEPDLWSATHAEVHPQKARYDELVMRNTEFAQAIKTVWPEAPVLGFVSFGWAGFQNLNGAPDATDDFITYYLSHMRDAEAAAGHRLIDYLDLHWYPEARGAGIRIVYGGSTSSNGMPAPDPPDLIAARVQAPRSLWDPGYAESSWITSAAGPIALIPRMQRQIDASYPGTLLSFTEWNYGGGSTPSGAVAVADVLGVFGREGVGAANMWPSGSETYSGAAFRAYRNYDGAGSRFGDRVVSAHTSSIFSSSVYASVDAADPTRLVIVAINKRASPTDASIQIAGGDAWQGARVYVLDATAPALRPGDPLAATAPGTFQYQMPALSVSVIVPTATVPDTSVVDGGTGDATPDAPPLPPAPAGAEP